MFRARAVLRTALLLLPLSCGKASDGAPAKTSDVVVSPCRGAPPVTLEEVQAIVNRRCTSCHSPSGPASDYDWTNPRALVLHHRNIAAQVSQDTMPPRGLPRLGSGDRQRLSCWGG